MVDFRAEAGLGVTSKILLSGEKKEKKKKKKSTYRQLQVAEYHVSLSGAAECCLWTTGATSPLLYGFSIRGRQRPSRLVASWGTVHGLRDGVLGSWYNVA